MGNSRQAKGDEVVCCPYFKGVRMGAKAIVCGSVAGDFTACLNFVYQADMLLHRDVFCLTHPHYCELFPNDSTPKSEI